VQFYPIFEQSILHLQDGVFTGQDPRVLHLFTFMMMMNDSISYNLISPLCHVRIKYNYHCQSSGLRNTTGTYKTCSRTEQVSTLCLLYRNNKHSLTHHSAYLFCTLYHFTLRLCQYIGILLSGCAKILAFYSQVVPIYWHFTLRLCQYIGILLSRCTNISAFYSKAVPKYWHFTLRLCQYIGILL
jgi:hypothetical protein